MESVASVALRKNSYIKLGRADGQSECSFTEPEGTRGRDCQVDKISPSLIHQKLV